jgi:hypothetical protein
MKKTNILILVSLIIFGCKSQQSWLSLNYPQSDIIGKPVESFKNGDINYSPILPSVFSTKLDESQSSDDIVEYNEQFKNFITKYFNKNKYKVTEIKAHKLQIKSLNISDVQNMEVGKKYIYSGLSADSVKITIKLKKETNVDYTKVVKDISGLITSAKIIADKSNVLSLFDSISSQKKDSIYLKTTIANPNIYFKIKMIKYKKSDNHDWEKYWKSFTNSRARIRNPISTDPDNSFNLIYTPNELQNYTDWIFPEFWGPWDRKDVNFRLIAKKNNGELKLFIEKKEGNLNNKIIPIEIPSTIVNGKKYWKFDRSLVHTFEKKNKTKLVYIQIRAEENGSDTIKVLSWFPLIKDKLTFMQYPEVKLNYVEN